MLSSFTMPAQDGALYLSELNKFQVLKKIINFRITATHNPMQKLLPLLAYFLLFGIVIAGLTSCKDDDDEPSRVTLSFSSSSKEVGEGEQGVKVNLVLDTPAPADLIIEYSISGTATRKVGLNAGDFEIVGSAGEVEIAKGATTGSIELNILTDNILEQNETIILTLEDVSSALVDIGDKDQVTLTIVGGGNVTASFATATSTVNEADPGVHEVIVQIDQANAADVVVNYQLKQWLSGSTIAQGVAVDSLSAVGTKYEPYIDYQILGESGKVTIPAGQTTGKIRLKVYSDFYWEDTEHIELTLIGGSGITVGSTSKHTMTVTQESGKALELYWPQDAGADMDLFLWLFYMDNGELAIDFVAASLQAGNTGFEGVFIPEIVSEELAKEFGGSVLYGASYVYYSGGDNDLEFESAIANVIDGEFDEIIDVKSGTYTKDNINAWDDDDGYDTPIIAQVIEWSNGEITEFSDIIIPDESSRPRTAKIKEGLKKTSVSPGSKRFSRR